jgi:hypothetical protein
VGKQSFTSVSCVMLRIFCIATSSNPINISISVTSSVTWTSTSYRSWHRTRQKEKSFCTRLYAYAKTLTGWQHKEAWSPKKTKLVELRRDMVKSRAEKKFHVSTRLEAKIHQHKVLDEVKDGTWGALSELKDDEVQDIQSASLKNKNYQNCLECQRYSECPEMSATFKVA